MPYYSRRFYVWTAVVVIAALGAAWLAGELVEEPVTLDLSTAAAVFGLFMVAIVALSLWHDSSRKRPAVGFWEKVLRYATAFLFVLALSVPIIGIGHVLADVIGLRTQLDYVEPYPVTAESIVPNPDVAVEARASYRGVILNAVTRTGSPYWFSLCAADGYESPQLLDDSAVFHVTEGQQVALDSSVAYDKDRDPRRRDECSREEIRVYLEVPHRERVCLDVRYTLAGEQLSDRSCWDLVHEVNDDVFMLRDILRL